ncbi:YceI family protein [Polynucleobacter kasalickyi]|uniref:YceI-like domain-containing protein n=1 Tax=Polynucleobacter kasalickyi TaxID=1938817 RepID=A0A1W1YIU3_9BURK|nr:YceI family protein [Polynucleobacter kasalickyi]SMC36089.1 YceI-like domain-containing protein [Polynucleobacter kasalickyi]
MKNTIQWGFLPLIAILSACTVSQVPETIPSPMGTWFTDHLAADFFWTPEMTIAPVVTPDPIKPKLYSGKLMVPVGATLINSEKSILTVHVNKGGLLASIGHQHMVASRNIIGWVDQENNQGFFSFDIAKMTVDESNLLRAKKLPDTLKESEKEATKQNMMKMLDVKSFPDVRVQVTQFDRIKNSIHAKIFLKNQMVEKDLFVNVTRSANNKITNISGETRLKLSDFAVEPFSALAGLLSVDNEMMIEWKLAFD